MDVATAKGVSEVAEIEVAGVEVSADMVISVVSKVTAVEGDPWRETHGWCGLSSRVCSNQGGHGHSVCAESGPWLHG